MMHFPGKNLKEMRDTSIRVTALEFNIEKSVPLFILISIKEWELANKSSD